MNKTPSTSAKTVNDKPMHTESMKMVGTEYHGLPTIDRAAEVEIMKATLSLTPVVAVAIIAVGGSMLTSLTARLDDKRGGSILSRCPWLTWTVLLFVIAYLTISVPAHGQESTASRFEIGESVPPLKGIDLNGKDVEVDFAKLPKSLLYEITPNGPFVVKNEARFAALVRRVGKDYAIVVVSSRDVGLGDYIKKVRPTWGAMAVTVVGGISPEVKKALRIWAYPTTMAMHQGKVVLSLGGPYDEANATTVERFFKFSFAK